MGRQSLHLLVACALAALSCSPLSSFRPASGLMPGTTRQVGLGGTVVTPRPYVDEPAHRVGHVWFGSKLGKPSDLSLIAAFDSEGMAVGGALALRYVQTSRFSAAAEFEAGYAWGAIAAPFSVRLFDQTHLYTSPRLGNWGLEPVVGIPVGLSVRLYEGLSLRGEWQRSWQAFQYYNRRDHFGVAAAYDF